MSACISYPIYDYKMHGMIGERRVFDTRRYEDLILFFANKDHWVVLRLYAGWIMLWNRITGFTHREGDGFVFKEESVCALV